MKAKSIIFFLITLFSFELLSQTYQTEKWEILDIKFSQKFGAIITHENGTEINIPGFYNGNDSWVISFSVSETGKRSFTTHAVIIYKMDKGIGKFVDVLNEQGIYDNALVMSILAEFQNTHTYGLELGKTAEEVFQGFNNLLVMNMKGNTAKMMNGCFGEMEKKV